MCASARGLTLQLLEQEGLAAAPLGVQTHADGRLHGGFAQDVCQSRAVQVVTQHVSVRLCGRQVTCRGGGDVSGEHQEDGNRNKVRKSLTGSKDLGEDALLVAAVDVVRRLPGLVGAVQQAAIFGVTEQELGQAAAPPADGDMEGRISFLDKQNEGRGKQKGWSIRLCTL